MTPRTSKFNNDELQMDTVENANRPVLQYAEEYVKTGLRTPLENGSENYKRDFRTMEALDHVNEPQSTLKAVFAYPGTDKGVNQG